MKYLMFFAVFLTACTDNDMARSFGGSMQLDLPCDQKLVDITWKETELWYATRPMREGEFPETTTFTVDKGLSLMTPGHVTVVESKCIY